MYEIVWSVIALAALFLAARHLVKMERSVGRNVNIIMRDRKITAGIIGALVGVGFGAWLILNQVTVTNPEWGNIPALIAFVAIIACGGLVGQIFALRAFIHDVEFEQAQRDLAAGFLDPMPRHIAKPQPYMPPAGKQAASDTELDFDPTRFKA